MTNTSKASIIPPTLELKSGELYVGTVISADYSRHHHIILLPGEVEDKNWKGAIAWAESIGGELPDRVEGALLFATMKAEFQKSWYWTREQHAAFADYAWFQDFNDGTQSLNPKNVELRARAVRRVPV